MSKKETMIKVINQNKEETMMTDKAMILKSQMGMSTVGTKIQGILAMATVVIIGNMILFKGILSLVALPKTLAST